MQGKIENMEIRHGRSSLIILKSHQERDILKTGKILGLHPVVMGELMRPTLRPKVEGYDDYLYLVLHFPIFNAEDRKTYPHEIDFVITKETLLVVEHNEIQVLRDFYQKLFQDKDFRERHFANSPSILLHSLISFLYDYIFRQLDHVQRNIDIIDKRIYSNREKKIVREISFVRRDILGFILALRPQRLPLESLRGIGKEFFGREFLPYFDNLIGDYARIWNLLETYQETLQMLHETNESLLSARANEIIKTLTIMAVLALPATLIANIFGMSTRLPIIDQPNGFWIILGLMSVSVIIAFAYFKKRKWI